MDFLQKQISSFTLMHTIAQTDAQTHKYFNTYTGGHDDVHPWPPSIFVPTPLLEGEKEAHGGVSVCAWGSDCDDLFWLVPLGNV